MMNGTSIRSDELQEYYDQIQFIFQWRTYSPSSGKPPWGTFLTEDAPRVVFLLWWGKLTKRRSRRFARKLQSTNTVLVPEPPPEVPSDSSFRKRNNPTQGGVISFWWGKLDSDQRSQRQQIYSLPPLATREFPRLTALFGHLQSIPQSAAFCQHVFKKSRKSRKTFRAFAVEYGFSFPFTSRCASLLAAIYVSCALSCAE